MPNNIPTPIAQVMQHPGVPITPAVVVPAKVGVDHCMVAHADSKLHNGKEEHLLRVNTVISVTSEDGDLCFHPHRQCSQAKVSVELAQLTLVEVCYFQSLDVIEVGEC
jgi:hypothetical protein